MRTAPSGQQVYSKRGVLLRYVPQVTMEHTISCTQCFGCTGLDEYIVWNSLKSWIMKKTCLWRVAPLLLPFPFWYYIRQQTIGWSFWILDETRTYLCRVAPLLLPFFDLIKQIGWSFCRSRMKLKLWYYCRVAPLLLPFLREVLSLSTPHMLTCFAGWPSLSPSCFETFVYHSIWLNVTLFIISFHFLLLTIAQKKSQQR